MYRDEEALDVDIFAAEGPARELEFGVPRAPRIVALFASSAAFAPFWWLAGRNATLLDWDARQSLFGGRGIFGVPVDHIIMGSEGWMDLLVLPQSWTQQPFHIPTNPASCITVNGLLPQHQGKKQQQGGLLVEQRDEEGYFAHRVGERIRGRYKARGRIVSYLIVSYRS